MAPFQVKKVVVVCFLEAAKLALEQLGALRIEGSDRGASAAPELTRVYADARRVRDHLQRCVSAYGDVVDLDFDATDAAVLVACCRRYVESIDTRLSEQVVSDDDRAWLQKKLQVVSHWAVELAARPLLELPGKRSQHALGEASRVLLSRLQEKIFGPVAGRAKIRPPQSSGATGNGGTVRGMPSFGEQVRDLSVPADDTDADLGFGAALVATPAAAPAAPLAGSATPAAPAPPTPRIPAPASAEGVPALFDHQQVVDPRLRALIGVDMRAYQRACAAADHRLATVMLSTILEATLVDHVLSHRAEFDVVGTPDGWDLLELLMHALGDRASPKDRSLAFHLFSARNLLRPTVQFLAPMIVTSSSFEVLREFVSHALHELGYGRAVKSRSLGALDVELLDSLPLRNR